MSKMKSFAFAMIVFSGVILGMSAFYTDLNYTYSHNMGNYTENETFGVFNESFVDVNIKMKSIQNSSVGMATKPFYDLTKYSDAVMAFIDIGGMLIQLPNPLIAFMNQIGGTIGIIFPDWTFVMIIILITIFITMEVAAIFLKREEI